MRYRDVEQVVFRAAGAVGCSLLGLRLPRLLGGDRDRKGEGLAVFGDAVDGAEQLAHGGDEGELGGLAGGAQAFVEGAQPVVAAVGAGPEKRVVLLLDNAGWHTLPNLAVPNGIRLFYLPPYSPELQPAETLWTLVDEPIVNTFVPTLTSLIDTITERCSGLMHHSDRGSQYLALRYTERLADAGVEPSVGSVGDPSGPAAQDRRRKTASRSGCLVRALETPPRAAVE